MTAREKRRLVIADDSAAMRWLVRRAIGDEFGEIVEAADGRELLWTLLRSEFKHDTGELLVITDLAMPGYSGLDVLEVWRELQPAGRTLLITAFPSDLVHSRARAAGALMLPKPFSTAALRKMIDELVRRERSDVD
jgi:two-component system response regulator (stage 0 sporulation protein F)